MKTRKPSYKQLKEQRQKKGIIAVIGQVTREERAAKRCQELFDGATCRGHLTGAPRRCVRCGKYDRETAR